jgi:hypothetical protein
VLKSLHSAGARTVEVDWYSDEIIKNVDPVVMTTFETLFEGRLAPDL